MAVVMQGGCNGAAGKISAPEAAIRLAVPGNSSDSGLSLASLASRYSNALPNRGFQLIPLRGAVATVTAVHGRAVDVGLVSADVTYLAFHGLLSQSNEVFDDLRGIALVQTTTVQVMAAPHSNIRSVRDVAGHRIGVGEGSGMTVLLNPILDAYGVDATHVQLETANTSEELFLHLLSGRLDAIFFRNVYPNELVATAVQKGARLIPINGPALDRMRHEYPFVKRAVIPANTYARAEALETIAIDSVLLCRRDLDESVVYEITRGFFDELPNLSILGSRRFLDLEQAPAVPIPLHEGAARYYREVELRQ